MRVYRSWSPFTTLAAVILLAPEATVIAEVGRDLIATHPLATLAAVVLLASEATVIAKSCRDLSAAHPFITFAAVVLLASETAVIAEVCWVFSHRFKKNIRQKILFGFKYRLTPFYNEESTINNRLITTNPDKAQIASLLNLAILQINYLSHSLYIYGFFQIDRCWIGR